MFASITNAMQIHVYTYSQHDKCHICSCGVANVAFTIFAIGVDIPGGGLSCSFGRGVPLGSRKSYPLLE